MHRDEIYIEENPGIDHAIQAALWNRNYFLRFRFRLLLKSYGSGSGSNFWKVMVPVRVPVPTFENLRFRFQLHVQSIKSKFFTKNLWKFFGFLLSKLFYKEKAYKFQQIDCKMWIEKTLNEGNQTHNLIFSSDSGTVINYGSGSDFSTSYGSVSDSGSTSQKVMVPTVPVPVRFHNAAHRFIKVVGIMRNKRGGDCGKW